MEKKPLPAICAFTGGRPLYFVLLLIFSLATMILLGSKPADTLESLQSGMKGPDFALRSVDGKTENFARIKGGKLTILLFWSTWSPDSDKALKQMERLYDQYKKRGLSVMAVDVDGQEITDRTIARIKSKLDRLKISFPASIDYGLVTFHDYGVIAVPSTVILNKDRVIKYVLPGYPLMGSDEMADYIASKFAPAPARS